MKFHNYYTYITTNPEKTTLYTGVTNDLDRRILEHQEDALGRKRTFAGKYHCFNLIYYEYYRDVQEAIAREKIIKNLTRIKKEDLINFFNPEWRFLNSEKEQEKGDLPMWDLDMEDNRPW